LQIAFLLMQPLHVHSLGFVGTAIGSVLGIDSAIDSAISGAAKDTQDGAAGFISDELGVESNDFKFGINDRKSFQPSVNVVLTNTAGSTYTAYAQVSGLTAPQDAYYTWYIKNDNYDRLNIATTAADGQRSLPRADSYSETVGLALGGDSELCNPETIFDIEEAYIAESGGSDDEAGLSADDLEGLADQFIDDCGITRPGGDITASEKMEYYKISAIRAHMKTKFSPERYDSEFNDGNQDGAVTPDEYGDPTTRGTDTALDDDNDGYVAFVGGNNAFNGVISTTSTKRNGRYIQDRDNYCYLYDGSTGREFELVKSDQETGVTCMPGASQEDRLESDHNGRNPEWVIGCANNITSPLSCSVSPGVTAAITEINTNNSTTVTDPGTSVVTDPDTGEITVTPNDPTTTTDTNDTSVTITEEGDLPESRNLIQCEFNPNTIGCAPSQEDNNDTPVPVCSRGQGVPTCMPVFGEDSGSGFTPVELYNRLNNTSQQCSTDEQQANLLEYRRLESLIAGYRAILATAACSPLDNDTFRPARCIAAQSDLSAALGEQADLWPLILSDYQNDIPDDADFGDFAFGGQEADQLADELIARLFSTTDPNSFVCLEQSDPDPDTGFTELVYTDIARDELRWEGASCLDGLANQPNFASGDLFPDDDLENLCTEEIHLYPGAPGSPLDELDKDTGILGNSYTGDGKFTLGEEQFWGTNPDNAQTIQNSLNDEAIITGLGMQEFSWEYREGDEIGVVVEGVGANATKHDSQHPQTVFAFMDNGCQPQNAGFYIEEIRGDDIAFETVDMGREELDECLLLNFTTPGAVQQNGNLTVNIAGPDAAILNGQDFTIPLSAEVSNEGGYTENFDDIRERAVYDWKFYISDQDADGSTDLTENSNLTWSRYLPDIGDSPGALGNSDLSESKMTQMGLSQIKGAGLSEIEPTINLFEENTNDNTLVDKKFLRVVVEVNAPSDEAGVSRYGRSEFIVPLFEQERNELVVKRVQPVAGNADRIASITEAHLPDDPICDFTGSSASTKDNAAGSGEASNHLCRTIRNEILSFELPPDIASDVRPEFVSWDLDGSRLTCDVSVSTLCNDRPIVFVPALRNDYIHTVTATISDPSGGQLSGDVYSRTFEIVTPRISFIEHDASAVAKERGTFENLTGGTARDVSLGAYVRGDGNSFTLASVLEPSMLRFYTSGTDADSTSFEQRVALEWIEGDESISSVQIGEGIGHTFTVPEFADANPPRDFTVGARAIISTPEPIRDLLYEKFRVSPDRTGPMTSLATAIIHPPGTSTLSYLSNEQYLAHIEQKLDDRTVTATIFTNTPTYILFLLKVAITIGIILFLSSLLMPHGRSRYQPRGF